MKRIITIIVVAMCSLAFADNMAIFERAWNIVDERYWNPTLVGQNWDDVYDEYLPRAEAAETLDELYEIIEHMYKEIGDDHTAYLSPARVAEVKDEYGSMLCLNYYGATNAFSYNGPVRYGLLDTVGYIQLPNLISDGIANSLREAITAVESGGATALILDVRGNPGGQLVTMMEVGGIFTRGFLWRVVMRWSFPIPYPALGLGTFTDLPLVVLIDENVHSAAEGLAGALQSTGRATIIGTTTAGNVEAVLPFCLPDGSQAWVATGVLAPVLGPTWEGRGVEPDLYAPGQAALSYALGWLREQRQ